MNRIVLALLVSLSVVQTADAAPPAAVVPLIATNDAARLSGTWVGRVTSDDDRFSGAVEFRFTSEGAVIVPPQLPSRVLWVRVTSNGIRGALAPYFDRARRTEVYTVFEATLQDATLSGVVRERVGMRWTEAATWNVRRTEEGR